MLTFVIWALGIVLALFLLGVLLEALGAAAGIGALAGFGLYRLFKGAWRAGRTTKEKVQFAVMAAIGVLGAASAVGMLLNWIFA